MFRNHYGAFWQGTLRASLAHGGCGLLPPLPPRLLFAATGLPGALSKGLPRPRTPGNASTCPHPRGWVGGLLRAASPGLFRLQVPCTKVTLQAPGVRHPSNYPSSNCHFLTEGTFT